MKPRYWYISYDIASPRRLRRIAQLATLHGERVQKSLYLCALSPERFDLLHGQLHELVHPEEDRLMLRPLCAKCRAGTRTQGAGGHPERLEPFWIV